MTAATISFDPEKHEYRLAERAVPSVTQVISAIAPAWQAGEWYLQRGSAVHASITLALRDELDWSSVDQRIKGRIDSILRFISDVKLTTLHLETPLASGRYQFAGTFDFLGQRDGGPVVLADWKGSLSPQAGLQLGAYSLLLAENGFPYPKEAAAVECHDDSSYKVKWLTATELRRAEQTFLAFLTARNWLETNNIKPQP